MAYDLGGIRGDCIVGVGGCSCSGENCAAEGVQGRTCCVCGAWEECRKDHAIEGEMQGRPFSAIWMCRAA